MVIPDGYISFNNVYEKIKKYQEWGFKSRKKNELKTLYYKGIYTDKIEECDIIGYYNIQEILIELKSSKKRIIIFSDYLLQMQSDNFNRNLE